jgi:hypothetical protein
MAAATCVAARRVAVTRSLRVECSESVSYLSFAVTAMRQLDVRQRDEHHREIYVVDVEKKQPEP